MGDEEVRGGGKRVGDEKMKDEMCEREKVKTRVR